MVSELVQDLHVYTHDSRAVRSQHFYTVCILPARVGLHRNVTLQKNQQLCQNAGNDCYNDAHSRRSQLITLVATMLLRFRCPDNDVCGAHCWGHEYSLTLSKGV